MQNPEATAVKWVISTLVAWITAAIDVRGVSLLRSPISIESRRIQSLKEIFRCGAGELSTHAAAGVGERERSSGGRFPPGFRAGQEEAGARDQRGSGPAPLFSRCRIAIITSATTKNHSRFVPLIWNMPRN